LFDRIIDEVALMKKNARTPSDANQRKSETKTGGEGPQPAEGVEEECRCKEMSRKSLPELLKVAVSDLSFWKKKLK
jgi:hypothetical protein